MTLSLEPQNIIRQYFKDRFLRMALLLAALFNVITWLWLAYQSNSFPEVMPLHYNIYYGIDAYGPWFYIFMMPIVGMAILIVNFLVSMLAIRRERALSYMLVGTACATQLVILIASFAIVAINL
jgi:hypothetical protein